MPKIDGLLHGPLVALAGARRQRFSPALAPPAASRGARCPPNWLARWNWTRGASAPVALAASGAGALAAEPSSSACSSAAASTPNRGRLLGKALQAVIRGKVAAADRANADGWGGYNGLVDVAFASHFCACHGQEGFVREANHVNSFESFWQFLKPVTAVQVRAQARLFAAPESVRIPRQPPPPGPEHAPSITSFIHPANRVCPLNPSTIRFAATLTFGSQAQDDTP